MKPSTQDFDLETLRRELSRAERERDRLLEAARNLKPGCWSVMCPCASGRSYRALMQAIEAVGAACDVCGEHSSIIINKGERRLCVDCGSALKKDEEAVEAKTKQACERCGATLSKLELTDGHVCDGGEYLRGLVAEFGQPPRPPEAVAGLSDGKAPWTAAELAAATLVVRAVTTPPPAAGALSDEELGEIGRFGYCRCDRRIEDPWTTAAAAIRQALRGAEAGEVERRVAEKIVEFIEEDRWEPYETSPSDVAWAVRERFCPPGEGKQ